MMSRPLMQKGIVDLEDMFSDQQGDPVVLRQLKAELKHRKLARAVKLLKRVDAALAVVQQESGAETESIHTSVASIVDEVGSLRSSEKLVGGRSIKRGGTDALTYPSSHGVTEYEPKASVERAVSRFAQQSPISLTREEAYRVLGVTPASSWEVVEQARRALVERSRPRSSTVKRVSA